MYVSKCVYVSVCECECVYVSKCVYVRVSECVYVCVYVSVCMDILIITWDFWNN